MGWGQHYGSGAVLWGRCQLTWGQRSAQTQVGTGAGKGLAMLLAPPTWAQVRMLVESWGCITWAWCHGAALGLGLGSMAAPGTIWVPGLALAQAVATATGVRTGSPGSPGAPEAEV